VAFGGRLLAKARVEDCCCDDEEAEDDDLHDKTGNDDVGAHVAVVGTIGGGQESSTWNNRLVTAVLFMIWA